LTLGFHGIRRQHHDHPSQQREKSNLFIPGKNCNKEKNPPSSGEIAADTD